MVIVLLWDGVENGFEGVRGCNELYEEISQSEASSCEHCNVLTQRRECNSQISHEVSPAVNISCGVY